MFAITAITGRVGGALAEALLASGQAVRAIVRDEAKGARWAARGCDVAVADMQDSDRLTEALRGVDGAFILLPPLFDPTPGFPEARATIDSIRRALAAAAPRKAVILSTIGADAAQPNLLHALRLLEEALADLPIPLTFLRAAWFMENAEWDIPSAREQGVIHSYLQPLDRPIAMIATDDVGQTAARLLLETWTGHRVIELESGQRVSPDRIAEALGKALGRPVKAVAVPREQWEGIFRDQGMRNPTPRMQMIDGFNAGWIDFRGQGDGAITGRTDIDAAIASLVLRSSRE
jgi:NAD(P)H dehydrogenase (quinone)